MILWRRAAAVMVLGVLGAAALLWYGSRGGSPAAPESASTLTAPSPSPASPTARTTPLPATGQPTVPPVRVEQGRISGADPAARVQWELRAASLVVEAGRQEVRLERVEGKFFEQGRLVITFTAPRGIFQMTARDVILSGGVRARATSGRLVEAERMQWSAARRLLIATGHVRLVQDRVTMRADRLESDIGLRKTRLMGNITVTVRE